MQDKANLNSIYPLTVHEISAVVGKPKLTTKSRTLLAL